MLIPFTSIKLLLEYMLKKVYINSKLVNPVYEYTNPEPNKITLEDKAPSKKYFNPAEVELNFSLYKLAKTYNPKDCNSILKYIEIKSEEFIKNKAPKILNKIIKQYSFDLLKLETLL